MFYKNDFKKSKRYALLVVSKLVNTYKSWKTRLKWFTESSDGILKFHIMMLITIDRRNYG